VHVMSRASDELDETVYFTHGNKYKYSKCIVGTARETRLDPTRKAFQAWGDVLSYIIIDKRLRIVDQGYRRR